MSSRQEAERLDRDDPLASVRAEFVIPDNDLVYLDGNSLGRTPKATVARLKQVVENEWAGNLISSWDHWLDMPRVVGDRMGAIIGSLPGEVAVHDSTTLNLYQGVHIAIALRPDRKAVQISVRMSALLALTGRHRSGHRRSKSHQGWRCRIFPVQSPPTV